MYDYVEDMGSGFFVATLYGPSSVRLDLLLNIWRSSQRHRVRQLMSSFGCVLRCAYSHREAQAEQISIDTSRKTSEPIYMFDPGIGPSIVSIYFYIHMMGGGTMIEVDEELQA